MKRTRAFEPGDVVVVPFPFTDRDASKRRPALVCSTREFNEGAGHIVLAMITSSTHAPWPGDVPLRDLGAAGLSARSVVRWKLFTLPRSLVVKRIGALAQRDRVECGRRSPLRVD